MQEKFFVAFKTSSMKRQTPQPLILVLFWQELQVKKYVKKTLTDIAQLLLLMDFLIKVVKQLNWWQMAGSLKVFLEGSGVLNR